MNMASGRIAASAVSAAGVVALALASAAGLAAADWPHWRGPRHDGTSPETGLVASWSPAGENLIWRADFTGRSTPVVFAGRVCATGRAGEGVTREEVAACFDAGSGEKIWERRFPVYHTTVPWNRVGWANPTADPETGYLYVQGVGGLLVCLDGSDGRVVWSHQLLEEWGFMEGYGGRTQTPIVDEDRLIVTFASTSWGELVIPRHRVYAFDKRSGEPLWVSSPASSMQDKNTQSTPAVAVVGGRRLLVHGNGDGWIYALEARTGEKVWGFQLSKRGINTSVAVDGATVYAAHSEENLDEPTMGRVVAIDASGAGDVTASHERWRSPLGVGFASPTLAGGHLYLVDNGANLHALDAATGAHRWGVKLGTVGKGSPVVADGKLYVTEVNGQFHVVRLPAADPAAASEGAGAADRGEIVSTVNLSVGDRYAEIYGSPAVAYGRIYFTSEEGIYCLGDPAVPFRAEAGPLHSPAPEEPPAADAAAARIRVAPAEVALRPGETVRFRVTALDALGRTLGERSAAWSLAGLAGRIEDGAFTADPATRYQAGKVEARLPAGEGELTAAARVRVVADPPFADDFSGWTPGTSPPYLVNSANKFVVEERDGEAVLAKNPSPQQLHSHITFLGRSGWSAYTVEADVLGTQTGRRVPDVGVINSGYTLQLMGALQKLQLESWPAARRMANEVDFAWQPGVWYTLKLRVDPGATSARIRAKAWPRGEPQPEGWTIEVEDPAPIRAGSPGLSGYSPTAVYFDNLVVKVNES